MSFASARNITLVFCCLLGITACGPPANNNTDVMQADAYLNVAELYRSQGQFRAAFIETQNALQISPQYDKTRRFVSRLYMDMGDAQAGFEVLQQLIETNPADIEAKLLLAETQLQIGRYPETLAAIENLQPLTAEQQVQAFWLEGNANARNNNLIAAQEALTSAIDLDPTHTPSLINLSVLEFQAGNEFGAQEFLDQAIAADPRDVDVLMWQGQFALIQQKYPEAERAYFEALQVMGDYDTMTPRRMAALQSIIIPLQMQQKNAEALRYSQLIAATPQGQLQSTYSSAVALMRDGNFDQAADTISRVLSQSPNHAGSNILMGLTQYAQGNYAGAEESLTGLVDANSSTPEVIRILAASHLRLNRADRALAVLEEAVQNYPEDASILAMMALSHQSLGNIEQSIEIFNRALAIQPDSADILFALAGSYYLNEDTASAIEHLHRVLENAPDHTTAKITLIDLNLNANNLDQAAALVNQWLSQDSESVANNTLAGRVAFSRGDLSQAREYFNASLNIDPANTDALLFLARLNVDAEDYAAAEANFQQILQDNPASLQALSGLLALGDLTETAPAAIAEVSRIVETQPAEFIPPLVLAQYYSSKNAYEEALPSAELAYSRNSNVYTENTLIETIVQLANIAKLEADIPKARELSAYALGLRAEDIPLLVLAAGVEAQGGEYNAASGYIDRIRDLAPENSALVLELEGDLAAQQGDIATAAASFQQAWALTNSPGIGVKLHQALIVLARNDDADQFLTEWLAMAPNDLSANLLHGMALQQQNQDAQAIAAYEIAYEQRSDSVVALNNLAWLYQDSNPERALELSTRAADLYPGNADVLDTYGWILFKQGAKDRAIQILERAVELAPNASAIAEHLETARQ